MADELLGTLGFMGIETSPALDPAHNSGLRTLPMLHDTSVP